MLSPPYLSLDNKMADFYEGNCRGCRQDAVLSNQDDFTDVYSGASDRLALSGWPVRDRNGIGADGSYPQFDYEDRSFRQSVLTDGNFQNVNYSAPRQFQADNYDESYLYDSADASQNVGPLDYEPEFGSTAGRNRQNADFSFDGRDYQVQVADRNRGGWSAYDRAAYNSLIRTTDGLDGRSITQFDRSVTEDLGCARAVGLAISKAYGYDIREVNVNRLENKLRTLGFSEVSSTRDVKPGDVIIAYRENGDYSHSAIYLGNGEIFNNDSKTGVMRRESIDKFNSAQFKRFVVLRRPDQVPALNS